MVGRTDGWVGQVDGYDRWLGSSGGSLVSEIDLVGRSGRFGLEGSKSTTVGR